MTTRRYRLSDMELDFVSLVASGDDPMAEVVIAKAAPPEQPGNSPDKSEVRGRVSHTISSNTLTTEDRMARINKSDLDPDVLDYVEGLEIENETLAQQVEKAEADLLAKDDEIADLRAEVDADISKSAEEREKALLEKADPAVRALIEKSQREAKEAAEIAKAEREARLEREYIAKAEAMPHVAVEPAKEGETSTQALAGLLRRAADALGPEDAAALEKTFRAMNAQVEKSDLFKSIGSGGGQTTLSKSADARAADLMKADPTLTKEQAMVKVYEADPDLAMKIENGEDA